jgi:hypothetical protein
MDFSDVISISSLYKAAFQCFKGILWKDTAIKWKFNCLKNIIKLRKSLQNGTYKLREYDSFEITYPKRRIVHSTKLVDRVIQRSLCNNGLYEMLTKPLIYDNGACQVGKGTMFAIKRFKCHLSKYFKEHKANQGYYLKLDIKNYFGSVPHTLLKRTIAKYVDNIDARLYLFDVIDSYDLHFKEDPIYGHVGVGLGSQLSQLMMLLYLNDLDHYVKEKLKIKHYIRYMDDMILIHQNKEYLKKCFDEISVIVEQHGLKLNKKSKIGKLTQGIEFLKIKFHISETGKIQHKLCRSSIKRELRRLTKLISLFKEGKLSKEELMIHTNSWIGYGKYRMSRNQFRIINKHLKEIL